MSSGSRWAIWCLGVAHNTFFHKYVDKEGHGSELTSRYAEVGCSAISALHEWPLKCAGPRISRLAGRITVPSGWGLCFGTLSGIFSGQSLGAAPRNPATIASMLCLCFENASKAFGAMCRAMKPDDLSPEAAVPAQVKQDISEFWVCGTCGKVYWQGNQYGNALSRLTTRLDNLKLRPHPD